MTYELKPEEVWTSDNLKLMGMHYKPQKPDTCVLFIHGMAGNFIENDFTWELGQTLADSAVGFIYAHNRGYSHINDISTNKKTIDGGLKSVRIGVAYERFEDSLLDLKAWIEKAESLGYKKVVLAGHSLGANKVIHFLSKNNPATLKGVILLSPPDMVGNAKETGKSEAYSSLLTEAKANVKQGNLRKLLSKELWNYSILSSQTFLDLFEDFGPADNLPIMRNPEKFPELGSITHPILVILAEYDDIVIRSIPEDISVLKEKALKTKSFDSEIIPETNHVYEGKGKVLASRILIWLNSLT